MTVKDLAAHRADIDEIDNRIVALLAKRFAIASQVADLKRHHRIAVRLDDRIKEVLDRAAALAHENGAEPEAIRAIYKTIIETTCLFEEAQIKSLV